MENIWDIGVKPVSLALAHLAGISPEELGQLDSTIERLVEERNAEKIYELVKEYVNRKVRVLADKRYDRYLRETVMRMFTEKFMILVFVSKTFIEIHVFKRNVVTPDGLRVDGVKVLKEVLLRK